MTLKSQKTIALILCFFLTVITFAVAGQPTQKSSKARKTIVPKVWDQSLLSSLELPLVDQSASPVHVDSNYYYGIPVRPIYKSYPVYAPTKEPANYIEWLKQQEPQEVFDASKLKTKADWIKAGELVFEAPIAYGSLFIPSSEPNYLRDPAWYEKTLTPVAKDGTVPFYRYIVKEKGKIEIGILSCAMCHIKVMPDGTLIKGGQGNFPFDRATAYDLLISSPDDTKTIQALERTLYAAPWLSPDPYGGQLDKLSKEEIAAFHNAVPQGTMGRHGASPLQPVKVPNLFYLRERKYLDATGLIRHRDISDLMRYAALNQDGDFLARHKDFIPQEAFSGKLPEDPSKYEFGRYSDEQLYALSLYLYQLKPPTNPNKFDAQSAYGKKVFQREGCVTCHTPPFYTNNKLMPVEGFSPLNDHLSKYNIMSDFIGTDPNLTLKTRRGTGYYKVPSLKGIWSHSLFEHNGSLANLEDWFDPKRLQDNYEPTGFIGKNIKKRAIKGHPFGLNLSEKDKKALIRFLKTL